MSTSTSARRFAHELLYGWITCEQLASTQVARVASSSVSSVREAGRPGEGASSTDNRDDDASGHVTTRPVCGPHKNGKSQHARRVFLIV